MKKYKKKLIKAVEKTKTVYDGVNYPILDTGYKLRNADFKSIMYDVRQQIAKNFRASDTTDSINTRVLHLGEYAKDEILQLKAIVAGVKIVKPEKGKEYVNFLLVNCYVYQKNKKPRKISEHMWFQLSDIVGIDNDLTVSLGDVIAFSAQFSEYKKRHTSAKMSYTTYGISKAYIFNSGYPNLSKSGHLVKDNFLPINYARHGEMLFQVQKRKFMFGKQILDHTRLSGRELYDCLVDLKMSRTNEKEQEFMPYDE